MIRNDEIRGRIGDPHLGNDSFRFPAYGCMPLVIFFYALIIALGGVFLWVMYYFSSQTP